MSKKNCRHQVSVKKLPPSTNMPLLVSVFQRTLKYKMVVGLRPANF